MTKSALFGAINIEQPRSKSFVNPAKQRGRGGFAYYAFFTFFFIIFSAHKIESVLICLYNIILYWMYQIYSTMKMTFYLFSKFWETVNVKVRKSSIPNFYYIIINYIIFPKVALHNKLELLLDLRCVAIGVKHIKYST